MSLLDKFAAQRALRAGLAESGRVAPIATPMDRIKSATAATIDGRGVILAGTNNYLGLTYDATCRAAAIEAIEALLVKADGEALNAEELSGLFRAFHSLKGLSATGSPFVQCSP